MEHNRGSEAFQRAKPNCKDSMMHMLRIIKFRIRAIASRIHTDNTSAVESLRLGIVLAKDAIVDFSVVSSAITSSHSLLYSLSSNSVLLVG